MVSKIEMPFHTILEPSAGKGDIVEYLCENQNNIEISTIEIDKEFRSILKGKNITVIDTDFLTFSGPDKFDLIIANPPFDTGDLHLLKAINIMYSGEIIFLLNAETIKNPYTNIRKELVKKLNELNASIEYLQAAFKNSERPTGVEIVLIHIKIEKSVDKDNDLFTNCNDTCTGIDGGKIKEEDYEVATKHKIADLVAIYNQILTIGTQTIIEYFKNYKKIGEFIFLNQVLSEYSRNEGNMTTMMQNQLNKLLKDLRIKYWRKTLTLPEVTRRMTTKKREAFEVELKKQCHMDFTENNIRQFILNLIDNYEQTFTEAVLEIFDKFTIRHAWSDDNLYNDNIHYFNGWKTNKAFKVNEKVIIPIFARYYSSPFIDEFSNTWKLAFGVTDELSDIDKVMNSLDGWAPYLSIGTAINDAFSKGESRKIKSTYFTITCYKKGTIHLTFNDKDILRRFNVIACKGKNWLPQGYGDKEYSKFCEEEKKVVDTFEGEHTYTKHLYLPLFTQKEHLKMLGLPEITKTKQVKRTKYPIKKST